MRQAVASLIAALAVAIAAPVFAQKAPKAGRQPLAAAMPATGFAGIWIDDTGDGAVEIKPCVGTRTEALCGSIVWLKTGMDASGKPLRDGNNEDAKDRGRPICGLPTIGGLKRQPGGTLDDGWIYDPRRGQKFDLELTLKGPDKLQVVGYKAFKFLSKTFIWSRAPANLPRCTPPV